MLKLWKSAVLALALATCFAAGWFVRPIWERGIYKTFADIPEPFLASDDKEYLGEVVIKCLDSRTGETISYKIRQADGKMIERPAKGIQVRVP
jgi:hypothetical protein